MEKINILCIFSNHFATLRHHTKGTFSFGDFALFYLMPLVIAIFLATQLPNGFLSNLSSELITFYSVLGGFMLNLLVLVYGFDVKNFERPDVAEVVLKEIAANISYLVTLASIVILTLFSIKIYAFLGSTVELNVKGFDLIFAFKQAVIVFIIGSLINFSLTILMVLRRFYALDKSKKQ
jgi:hypothetical protein